MATSSTVRCRLLVKLGGAAITLKNKFETPNDDHISLVCSQIAALYQKFGPSLILCHGAGSFGHHTAKEYGVKGGWASEGEDAVAQRIRLGFSLTRLSVTKLNSIIVAKLTALGVPAVRLSPLESGWCCEDGRVLRDGIVSISSALEAQLVPVLHGDCVLDASRGCTILSADLLMSRIADKMDVYLAVFLTDVDGIFDRDPSDSGARLIERFVVDRDGRWTIPGSETTRIEVSSSTCGNDVTGGMYTKLNEALEIVKGGTRVLIGRLGGEGGKDALEGIRRDGACTEISSSFDS
jgi:isopentenyl phosphate kinase